MRICISFISALVLGLVCGSLTTAATAEECDPKAKTCFDSASPKGCNAFTLGTSMLDKGGRDIIACLNSDSGRVWKAMTSAASTPATPAPTPTAPSAPSAPSATYLCPPAPCPSGHDRGPVTCFGGYSGMPTCKGCYNVGTRDNPYAGVAYGDVGCTKM